MPKTIVVTGSVSGMGLASKRYLEHCGVTVIGIDCQDGADIKADLSDPEQINEAISRVKSLCNGKLDGVFANAGVDNENAPLVFGVNYFGVIQMLEGLQPFLKDSGEGRVVINASNSVVITPALPGDVIEALLALDKEKAYGLISQQPHWTYQTSKVAITKWARKAAVSDQWAGAGISMNIIAPGVVLTPLIEQDMSDERKGAAINRLPKPIGSIPRPEDIAPLVKFLLLDQSTYIVGQYIIIDGGTEAYFKGSQYPEVWDISLDEFRKLM